MALTALDPETALIVVDLQKGVVGSAFVHPIGEVSHGRCALADAFRARGLPVALVNVAGARRGERNSRARSPPFRRDGPTSSPSSIGRRATSS